MRQCHFLPPTVSNELPSNIIIFDTETDQVKSGEKTVKHVLNFGWAAFIRRKGPGIWTKPEWYEIRGILDFWIWVEQHVRVKTKLYVFCHNTNFDLPVLDVFKMIPELGFILKLGVIDAPPTIIKYSKKGKTILLLDTLNIWRVPLKVLGEKVGVPKMDMPDKDANPELWEEYCKNDVKVLMAALCNWIDFIDKNDFGGFAPTIASQAMRLYTHRFMTRKIAIHNDPEICALERESYKGGRNECFRLGSFKGSFTLFDVNSMYPYVMRKYQYPRALKGHFYNLSRKDLDKLLQDYALVIRSRVKTDEPVYSIKRKGKLIFPVGTFEVCLTTEEIEYALEHDHILECMECAYYDAGFLFREYVDYLYSKRIDAKLRNDLYEIDHYKLLLNSLYGKFGQKGIIWSNLTPIDDLSSKSWLEINAQTLKVTKCRQFSGMMQVQTDEIESKHSFPAIAAHVTANARLTLWRYINEAGMDNIYYCDTDSLLVNDAGAKNLACYCDAVQLGTLKQEETFRFIKLWGCKDYVFGKHIKHKGIKSKKKVLRPGEYEQEKWTSLKGMLRNDMLHAPETATIRKKLYRIYDKGIVQADGLVLPFSFPMSNKE